MSNLKEWILLGIILAMTLPWLVIFILEEINDAEWSNYHE